MSLDAAAFFSQGSWAEAWARRAPLVSSLVPTLLETLAPQPGERILDVGSGTGTIAVPLAKQLAPRGEVVAVDISAAVLQFASGAAARSGAFNARFLLLDATAPIPGAPFDAAVSLLGIMFFPDPVEAFANVRRHLRHGGRFAFICWQQAERNPLLAESLLAGHAASAAWTEADARSGSFSLADPSDLRSTLVRAGFRSVAVSPVEVAVEVEAAAVFDDSLLDLYGVPAEHRPAAIEHVHAALEGASVAPGVVRVPLAVHAVLATRD